MDARATFTYLRISPRKLGMVAHLVRGKDVQAALDLLKFQKRVCAKDVSKLIRSAAANATQKGGGRTDRLYVKSIVVNKGPVLKRWAPRARGSSSMIQKPMAHITVVLDERI